MRMPTQDELAEILKAVGRAWDRRRDTIVDDLLNNKFAHAKPDGAEIPRSVRSSTVKRAAKRVKRPVKR